MRTIKELLIVMLDYQDKFKTGLCHWTSSLLLLNVISCDECTILDDYIGVNRPKRYSSYSAFKSRNSLYYWISTHKAPRIRWIKKHIKLNK